MTRRRSSVVKQKPRQSKEHGRGSKRDKYIDHPPIIPRNVLTPGETVWPIPANFKRSLPRSVSDIGSDSRRGR